jgi:predicted NBD/HSP70 family sugar kinase
VISVARRALDGAVLDLTRQHGVITRLELAQSLEVTPATITNVVKRLLADSLLIESGHSASTGGKRRTLLQLNPASRYAVGLSFDRDQLTIAVTDFAGALQGQAVTPMPELAADDDGSQEAGQLAGVLSDQLARTLRALGVGADAVAGVGVADPVSDATPWLPPASSAPRLSVSAVELINSAVGRPVYVRDEATCAALGELWTGAMGEGACFATVYMSAQISAGLVIDGRAHDAAARGSLGHMSIDRNGPPCPCGARGCIDVLASPAAVVDHVLSNGPHARQLGLDGGRAALGSDFTRIARAAVQGDRTCLAAISDSAGALAIGVANLVTVLGLSQIFLSGPGFADAGGIYEKVISDRLAEVHRRGTPDVAVTLSALDLEAAAIGAAAVVLQTSVAG